MMGSHADALHDGNQRVFGNAGVLNHDSFECLRNRILPYGRQNEVGMVEGFHGFITGSP